MVPCFAKRDGSFKLNIFRAFAGEKKIAAQTEKKLSDVSLGTQMSRLASELSRGDKRRLELAMGLVQQPKILRLDEPTTRTARHDTNATIDLLKSIKESGMTKLIIEHDMQVVFSLADRISVLAGGRTIAQGTPMRLKEIRGLLNPIWEKNKSDNQR